MGQGTGFCCAHEAETVTPVSVNCISPKFSMGNESDLPSLLKEESHIRKGRDGQPHIIKALLDDSDGEDGNLNPNHTAIIQEPVAVLDRSRANTGGLSTVPSLPDVFDEYGMQRVFSEDEANLLRSAQKTWRAKQAKTDRERRAHEFESLIEQTRAQQMMFTPNVSMPANRYGEYARLPAFEVGRHVPVLALINPFSGAVAGIDILASAQQTPYYQERFFNIIDVVKDQRRGGLLHLFRIELCRAKDEAKAMGVRPRLISGGGDGTASFALFMVFAALRADETSAEDGFPDNGNGFIWSDVEMAESFPALAQMPLGSANDFGHTLGWGHRYPGCAERSALRRRRKKALAALRSWISSAIDPASRLANFDVYGIVPLKGEEACDFKVAELTGQRGLNPKVRIDDKDQLIMKEAGLPVPLFSCLYFSAGFAAYMTARFQMNRRRTPIQNKLEYARQAVGIAVEIVPPQLNTGLEGVRVTCQIRGEADTYFPPRAEHGNSGRGYREVGFLNINWQGGMANGRDRAPVCGRLCSTREPAKFNDGRVDMYRLKLASAMKNPGLMIQTDKRDDGMTLRFDGEKGKGIFFQWDGEARFAFSPSGQPFHINIKRILNIPVVLGPEYDPRVTGDADNGQPIHFGFCGATAAEQVAFRTRILRGVRGELNSELIGSREDMESVGLPCEDARPS